MKLSNILYNILLGILCTVPAWVICNYKLHQKNKLILKLAATYEYSNYVDNAKCYYYCAKLASDYNDSLAFSKFIERTEFYVAKADSLEYANRELFKKDTQKSKLIYQ